ncbi:MAG TPA: lipoyl(octanoyl) transferase LipB [Kofleriaceae bacterium]|jgi:lipoate-protein ligase B|nr:lipoyl(octanoyl) transferase LipB [Kofleriaceae bacterium]
MARLVDLGLAGFREVWQLQLETVAARQRGDTDDTLILVEHDPVITLGRARSARANVLMPAGVDVVEVERGGDVTWHGPGQLVAYPVVLLGEGERDLHAFLRNLEEAIIRTAAAFGLATGREPGKTGVWIDGRKLASIGIACRRWVTFHGLALNVDPDLRQFARINPCGFDASVMTSLAAELGQAPGMPLVKTYLATHLSTSLGRDFT